MGGPSPDRKLGLSDLVAHGLCDASVRAVEFSPPVGARGIQKTNRPTLWAATLTSTDASRPTIRAIRQSASEAMDAASDRFLAIFRDGKKLDAVDSPSDKKRTPPVQDDDDIEDMI